MFFLKIVLLIYTNNKICVSNAQKIYLAKYISIKPIQHQKYSTAHKLVRSI
jgi:hypothetical protein